MLARVSSTELTEWAAYERITGPLDRARRGDYQAALIAATIANVNRGPTSRVRGVEEFLLDWARPQTQTWQEQLQAVRQLNEMLGGTVTTRHDRE